MVESFKFELEEQPRAQLSILGPQATPTKKRTRAQSFKTSKSFNSTASVAVASRKKQKASSKLSHFSCLVTILNSPGVRADIFSFILSLGPQLTKKPTFT